jgi:hypothetical protein
MPNPHSPENALGGILTKLKMRDSSSSSFVKVMDGFVGSLSGMCFLVREAEVAAVQMLASNIAEWNRRGFWLHLPSQIYSEKSARSNGLHGLH